MLLQGHQGEKPRRQLYTFECKDLDTKQSRTLDFSLSGFLEAADDAFTVMKSPKDIFFLDLDNKGKWKVISEDQMGSLRLL
jgi:hypothetical protein